MFSEDDLLPLSALAQMLFCERRAALIHIENIWSDNVATLEGSHLHQQVDLPGVVSRGDLRGVPLRSLRLGLSGKADVVEFHLQDGPPLGAGPPAGGALRDNPGLPGSAEVEKAAALLAGKLGALESEPPVDALRGIEGDAARIYFSVFDHLIVAQKDEFRFVERSRRPPLDSVNALLSFLYALLAHDGRAACKCAGLDPVVGFLHADRPGRPSLALDLMEELRPFLADRLVLVLINRQQIHGKGFRGAESGGIQMDDATCKEVLVAYQKRKQEELVHPFLQEKCPVGLVAYLQARLLARHLRGDQDGYPPFIWK